MTILTKKGMKMLVDTVLGDKGSDTEVTHCATRARASKDSQPETLT
jgi:hypothetical protein